MTAIVDYSYARPGGDTIVSAGFVGAMRYLGTDGRCIKPPELADLHAAGCGVGFVWETDADRTLSGEAGGRYDATQANGFADALGVPFWVPIFGCAIDFNANESQIRGDILAYLEGFKTVSPRPVGMYGHYLATEILVGEGHAKWGWQCAAWSGSGSGSGGSIQGRRASEHACMFQRVGYVLNNSCDTNDVLKPINWLWFGGRQPPIGDDDVTPDDIEAIAQRTVELLTNAQGDGPVANLTQIRLDIAAPAEATAQRTSELLTNQLGDGPIQNLTQIWQDVQATHEDVKAIQEHLCGGSVLPPPS